MDDDITLEIHKLIVSEDEIGDNDSQSSSEESNEPANKARKK